MSELIQLDILDGVADVRLNRPEKYNALNPKMFEAILDVGKALATMSDLRVVVLSGNGKGFCAGLDMASFQDMLNNTGLGSQDSLDSIDSGPENFVQRPAYLWREIPVPVIAAIHGVAYGGGCQIALGADIRFAAEDAKISILEVKWGLRDVVSQDVAKELTFTGRILNGFQAKELGLVTHVTKDPLEGAMALATEISEKSPSAVRGAKKLYRDSWHADTQTGLALEASIQKSLIGTENQIEAITANFENRVPTFKDV